MKTRMYMFIFLLTLGVGIARCSSNNNSDDEDTRLPTQAVETAFWAKYSSASSVQWEQEGRFQKAEFVWNNKNYEAWYNLSGIWLQAEYSSTYSALPSAVKDLIANSINYPPTSWTPDVSVEVLERKDYAVWYGIELKNGAQQVMIWSDENGYQSKAVEEDFDGSDAPQAISSFVATNYSQGFVTEVWQLVNASYEVNLLDENEVKQVYFDRSMNWIYTEWAVALADVPQVVKAVLNGSAYQGYTVRMVSYQQYSSKSYYHFILKQTSGAGADTNVNIDSNGNIVL